MNKTSIQELLRLLLPYKYKIYCIVILLIFNAGFTLILPLISKSIMDEGFIGGNQKLLFVKVFQVLFVVLFICIIDIIKEKIRIRIQYDLKLDLTEKSFNHLMRLNLSYFHIKNNTAILSNLRTDIENLCMIADNSLFFVFAQIFSIIGGLIGLFILNIKLAILIVLLIPIKYLIAKYFADYNKKIMKNYILSQEKYSKWFGDAIFAVKEIKLFNLFKHKSGELKYYQQDVVNNTMKMNLLLAYNIATDKIIMQILLSCIYIFGAIQIFNLETTLGTIFAFISYSAYVTSPITAIMNIKQMFAGILPCVERFFDFMNIEEEKNNGINIDDVKSIEFDNVSMDYDKDNKKNIIKNFSYTILKNSKIAILGTNGAGKSTIINLLLRLYDYSTGTIKVNGVEIKNYDLNNYRSMFSVVSQDVILFDGTIRENLCLYDKFTDDEIDFAIKSSGLSSFVKEHSLNYIVGNNGGKLSGGEKQKISLARAILHKRPVLILDEATSNTDIYSKKYIYDYLLNCSADKIVIIITHSNDILKMMDNILLIDNGQIIGKGTYQDMINDNKIFCNMIEELNK